jgi:hypothetical protein
MTIIRLQKKDMNTQNSGVEDFVHFNVSVEFYNVQTLISEINHSERHESLLLCILSIFSKKITQNKTQRKTISSVICE